jgi:PTS system nitrogen regulatory IIA component
MDVADKRQLLDEIGQRMQRLHDLPHDWVTQSLSRREQAGSTGVGEGVAIPHARVQGLERIQVAYIRLGYAIPFGSPDHKPVTHVLVLLVPKPATDEHLLILAEAARMFSDARFRTRLDACTDPLAVRQLFTDWQSA